MKRYLLIGTLAVSVIAASVWYSSSKGRMSPRAASDAEHKPTHRIVLLGASPAIKTVFVGFKQKLTELSRGSGLEFEYIDLDIPFSVVNMENAARYIAESGANLIITGQTEVPELMKRIKTTPIVSALSSNAVEFGLAASEQGSGTNVVFIDSGNYTNAGPRLEFFLELMPAAKHILVIRGDKAAFRESDSGMDSLQDVASRHGVTLTEQSFSSRQELNKFFLEYDFSDVDAIFRYPGTFNAANIDLFFAFQAQIKKPVVVLNRQELEVGGILAYGPRYSELGDTAATVAWQILKGQVDPASVPILRPFRYELGLNEGIARLLGVEIPDSLRKKADYILP